MSVFYPPYYMCKLFFNRLELYKELHSQICHNEKESIIVHFWTLSSFFTMASHINNNNNLSKLLYISVD